MGDPASNARGVFWIFIVLAWPFFAFQIFKLLTGGPVPLLGKGRGVAPIDLVYADTGMPIDGAFNQAVIYLVVEGIVFLLVTLFAYAKSGYFRQDY